MKVWLTTVGIFLLALCAGAQNKASGKLFTRTADGQVRAAIEVRIEPGWHLYHTEKGHPDAISEPLVITLGGEGIQWSEPSLPEPERHDADYPEGAWDWVHYGRITIHALGVLEEGADPAAATVALRGLTCSDAEGMCFQYVDDLESEGEGRDKFFTDFPADLAPAAAGGAEPGDVASGSEAGDAAGADESSQSEDADSGAAGSTDSQTPPPPAEGEDDGLGGFLLAAVFWGIFTLLMPCTYPMIPITISFFTKQADARDGKVLPLSLTYGAGIVLVFVLIGVVIGPPIVAFATHPVTNLIIGALFLYFALVLFGIVNLQPPRFLMNMAGKASARGGYAGVFLMGVTLVVTSFTCTAPFVGSLLAVGGAERSMFEVILGMGVFGLTMAVPFVFLSLVPGRMQALPKAGEWMHVLKVFLGFVEVAASLKFLSNTDLVWGWGVLSREVFLMLWFGIFLCAALFLFGVIRLVGESQREIGPLRMVGGMGTLLFSFYCGMGLMGFMMDDIMTAIIPPYSSERLVAAGVEGPSERKGHVIVKDDYQEALRVARAEKKLLLVNFTGFT